jgi:vesicle-fusing ATPase
MVSVLLHGPPGSGKTALAATIAQASGFPFIKLITPNNMVEMDENQKVAAITKVFTESYKSSMSVVVVDNIERLISGFSPSHRFCQLLTSGDRLVSSVLLESGPAGAVGTHRTLAA